MSQLNAIQQHRVADFKSIVRRTPTNWNADNQGPSLYELVEGAIQHKPTTQSIVNDLFTGNPIQDLCTAAQVINEDESKNL